ncbi:YgaB family protein [Bacillus sp. NPDC077027]|uniref:YgaB family protein n=1 Tax=Bacillus sp. NPDC077027 TaxID=3390548 RepID=UPI003D00E6A6
MSEFDQLVKKQMQLMDQLLDVQRELDVFVENEKRLLHDEKEGELDKLHDQIKEKRAELQKVQILFTKQTEQVIRSYKQIESRSSVV